jgi:hypothetical protein
MQNHDRYLIYKLLGRRVEVRLPARFGGKRIQGVVERVCRDIFGNAVEVTINSCRHAFREPEAIVEDGSDILFLYGDLEPEPEPGEDGFEVPVYNAYDESLHEHLSRTARRPVSKTVFKVGDVKKSPGCRWRTRAAVG